jgi:tripartite-type tricarboxylate transporter receptor subunit TctC
VLQAPDVRAQLEHMGFKVAGGSPADLGQSLQSERPRYARAIQSAGLSLR